MSVIHMYTKTNTRSRSASQFANAETARRQVLVSSRAGLVAMALPYKKLGEQPPTYPQEMQRVLSPPAISVQQTRRGWCQECFGCEAKSEYKVYAGHLEEGQARDEQIPQLGHLLEESPCLLRCCCSASRPFTMPFTAGAEGQGAKVLEFRKGWNLPICCLLPAGEGDPFQCPCCCCLPTLETYAADGSLVGSASYLCDEKLFF